MRTFGHVLTAMITPFHEDGAVDYKAAAEIAKYLIAHGSDGLVVAGSTGEAATMTLDEKLRLFEVVLEAVGDRATIIGGTGSNDTKASIAATQAAEKVGIHGAMAVVPYYNKPPQEGMYQHFKAIAENTALPLVLYYVPGRTGSNLMPATVARLAKISNIAALKEASGNLEQIAEVVRQTPDDFLVYSGDDSLTLPVLSVGGCGIISVAAHLVGERMQEMIAAFYAGHKEEAMRIHGELLPIFRLMFITTNPIPVKTAVNLLGLPGGQFRLPMVEPSEAELLHIRQGLTAVGLLG